MDLKSLFTEEDAVSPVIGVILMVAITVILAAVIGAFVLDIGQTQESPPTATFDWSNNDKSDSGTPNGTVLLEHDGGDSISAEENLEVVFDGSSSPTTLNSEFSTSDKMWAGSETGNDGTDTISESGEAELIWTSSSGDSSETLTTHDWDFA